MYIIPAIDIKDGSCVRLKKGDYATVHKVAENPYETAAAFKAAGAEYLHMVDLDGAKDGRMKNAELICDVAKSCGMKVDVGGGIRNLKAIEYYLENGVNQVVLGSVAVKNPEIVKDAVKAFGDKIIVGIDAVNGNVKSEGWIDGSDINYIELAKRMEAVGVKKFVFTDIDRDGMLTGPNIEQLDALSRAVSADIVASGGVSDINDIKNLMELEIFGAICGKSVYAGTLDLAEAVRLTKAIDYEKYFIKSELIPAVIQEKSTGKVLMVAWMNRESMQITLETGYTWFWSRSRRELWNKGATSGHLQRVIDIYSDCDNDTLLITVEQTGAACHTGRHSCFFRRLK